MLCNLVIFLIPAQYVIFFLSFMCLHVKSCFGPYDSRLSRTYTHACTNTCKSMLVFFCVHISLLVSGNALTHVIHDNKDVELIHANPARCKAKKCCYANREISFQIAAANTGSDLKGKSCICVYVC